MLYVLIKIEENSNFLLPIKLIYWDLPNRQTTICCSISYLNYTIKLVNNSTAKPNYKGYYKEAAFRKLYEGIPDADSIIKEAHGIRNSNPLSHSSAELIDSDKTYADILKSISDLGSLVESKVREL